MTSQIAMSWCIDGACIHMATKSTVEVKPTEIRFLLQDGGGGHVMVAATCKVVWYGVKERERTPPKSVNGKISEHMNDNLHPSSFNVTDH